MQSNKQKQLQSDQVSIKVDGGMAELRDVPIAAIKSFLSEEILEKGDQFAKCSYVVKLGKELDLSLGHFSWVLPDDIQEGIGFKFCPSDGSKPGRRYSLTSHDSGFCLDSFVEMINKPDQHLRLVQRSPHRTGPKTPVITLDGLLQDAEGMTKLFASLSEQFAVNQNRIWNSDLKSLIPDAFGVDIAGPVVTKCVQRMCQSGLLRQIEGQKGFGFGSAAEKWLPPSSKSLAPKQVPIEPEEVSSMEKQDNQLRELMALIVDREKTIEEQAAELLKAQEGLAEALILIESLEVTVADQQQQLGSVKQQPTTTDDLLARLRDRNKS